MCCRPALPDAHLNMTDENKHNFYDGIWNSINEKHFPDVDFSETQAAVILDEVIKEVES